MVAYRIHDIGNIFNLKRNTIVKVNIFDLIDNSQGILRRQI